MRWIRKHWTAVVVALIAEGMVVGLGYTLSNGVPKIAIHPWVFIVAAMVSIPLLIFWAIRHYERRAKEGYQNAIIAAADMDLRTYKDSMESLTMWHKRMLDQLAEINEELAHLKIRVATLERERTDS